VHTERVAFHIAERPSLPVVVEGPESEQARQSALVLYYRHHDLKAAMAAWERQSEPPAGPTQLAMLADAEAENGSDAAERWIDGLRAYQPAEADTILGALRLRQGRTADAAAALERALRRLHSDPWPLTAFKLRALRLASEAAERDVNAAPRLYAAITQPFAVRAADDARRLTAAWMTRVMDFPRLCRDAVAAFEPHVPWTADFLGLRHDCYEATHDPRLAAAARDVRRFVARNQAPLAARIP
jgi:hypothetical protein